MQRLREASNIKADHYARQVQQCLGRSEMSSLIREMKQLVRDAEDGG